MHYCLSFWLKVLARIWKIVEQVSTIAEISVGFELRSYIKNGSKVSKVKKREEEREKKVDIQLNF